MIAQIVLFLLFIGLLSFFQVRSLLSQQKKKEIAVYLTLMSGAGLIGALMLAGIEVPSPAPPIRAMFEPISKLIFPKP